MFSIKYNKDKYIKITNIQIHKESKKVIENEYFLPVPYISSNKNFLLYIKKSFGDYIVKLEVAGDDHEFTYDYLEQAETVYFGLLKLNIAFNNFSYSKIEHFIDWLNPSPKGQDYFAINQHFYHLNNDNKVNYFLDIVYSRDKTIQTSITDFTNVSSRRFDFAIFRENEETLQFGTNLSNQPDLPYLKELLEKRIKNYCEDN